MPIFEVIIKDSKGNTIPEEKIKNVKITNELYYVKIKSINKNLENNGFDIK